MKALTRLLGALLAVGVTGIALQRNAVSQVRRENQLHRREIQAVENSVPQRVPAVPVSQEDSEIQKLRSSNAELPRLRNEVRQLREQAHELANLRVENERLRSAAAASTNGGRTAPDQSGLIPIQSLAFSGYATPEAAFKSMLWAMSQGNAEQLLDSVSPDIRDKMKAKLDSEGADSLRRESAAMSRFRVVATKMTSDSEALLGLQIEVEGQDQRQEVAVPFKLIGSEWRINVGL